MSTPTASAGDVALQEFNAALLDGDRKGRGRELRDALATVAVWGAFVLATPAGALGLAGQAVFGLMPWWVTRRGQHDAQVRHQQV